MMKWLVYVTWRCSMRKQFWCYVDILWCRDIYWSKSSMNYLRRLCYAFAFFGFFFLILMSTKCLKCNGWKITSFVRGKVILLHSGLLASNEDISLRHKKCNRDMLILSPGEGWNAWPQCLCTNREVESRHGSDTQTAVAPHYSERSQGGGGTGGCWAHPERQGLEDELVSHYKAFT